MLSIYFTQILDKMSTNNTVQMYIPLHYPDVTSDSSSEKLLSGLGKATRRGIKKCYKCGGYNGTRSTMCKNKNCGVVLKDSEEKSKVNLDAVKLITGTERQIYSVRVRDMGPDYRGFVQLPLLHSNEETNIFSKVALCFVNSCQNSFDNSILRCHEENQNNNLLCPHINSALKSQSTASPVEVKNDVLHCLRTTDDIKGKLYLLATEKDDLLVQRVSKSIMAVKCQVTPKHPLGYLHFTFARGKSKDVYEKYYCSCTNFMVSGAARDKSSGTRYKCIHYYACIWALASNLKCNQEFASLVSYELPMAEKLPVHIGPNVKFPLKSKPNLNIKPQTTMEKNTGYKSKVNSVKDIAKIVKKPAKKSRYLKPCKKLLPKTLPVEIKVLTDLRINQEDVYWNFLDWLSYVTESINKTMQFENCGILNTLIFHIPEHFYSCFKKRIPSMYEAVQSEYSFSYSVMHILHLKEIFDTPQIKLKISKKFVHVEQKGYIEYDENEENGERYQCPFIFFLNVGQSTVDESDNTNNAFVIEWLPTVNGLTKIGQLKLQYKYGHKSI